MKKKVIFSFITLVLSSFLLISCQSIAMIQTPLPTISASIVGVENTVDFPNDEIVLAEDSSISSSEIQTELTVDLNYTTITEVEDWGPAITKVVLHFGTTLSSTCLIPSNFTVQSERQYIGFSNQKSSSTVKLQPREITNVYFSDEKGEATESGTCVTLDLKIGPTLEEASPFTESVSNGFNTFVNTTYHIGIAEGHALYNEQGTQIFFPQTTAQNNAGNISLVADNFDCSGIYQDSTSGRTLTYACFIPNKNASIFSTPLIIWLHGAGEGGTDPRIAIMGNKVTNLATPAIQNLFGATGAEILVPQTATIWLDDGTGAYMNLRGSESTSLYTQPLMSLIQNYVANHPEIDPSRIYIGGCSNGGYMTINMLVHYPDYFAAAFPVCEAYSVQWLTPDRLNLLKNIPIWLTASKTDATVRLFEGNRGTDGITYNLVLDQNGNPISIDNNSNALYKRLQMQGADNIHYTLLDHVLDTTGLYKKEDGSPYEYKGHLSWIYALNNQCTEIINGKSISLFEWLSMQHR